MRRTCKINTAHLEPFLVFVLLLFVVGGCQSKEAPSTYVARVGDHYLTGDDVRQMLDGMGPTPDTTEARRQIIEQWITRTLLYREAVRLNLESVEEVQRKLEQQRRDVLTSAMTNRLYERTETAPSQEEVRTYFEGHKEEFKLAEPHLKVRYLVTDSWSKAQTVRQRLASNSTLDDSTWTRLVRTHASDSSRSHRLTGRFLSVSNLTQAIPISADRLSNLAEGQLAPAIEEGGTYHVLQLTGRLEEGAEPKLKWVEDEIRHRLRIRARKQTYTREVQRLRNKAQANGALDTP